MVLVYGVRDLQLYSDCREMIGPYVLCVKKEVSTEVLHIFNPLNVTDLSIILRGLGSSVCGLVSHPFGWSGTKLQNMHPHR